MQRLRVGMNLAYVKNGEKAMGPERGVGGKGGRRWESRMQDEARSYR